MLRRTATTGVLVLLVTACGEQPTPAATTSGVPQPQPTAAVETRRERSRADTPTPETQPEQVPTFEGKTFAAWFADVPADVDAWDGDAAKAAREAIASMGKAVVPELIAKLQDPDGGVRARAFAALAWVGWGDQIGDSSGSVIAAAATALSKDTDARVRTVCCSLLRMLAFGNDGVLNADVDRAVIDAVVHDQAPRVRVEAITVLRLLPKDDATVVPALVACLTDADASVRAAALKGLYEAPQPADAAAIQATWRALDDPAVEVRAEALRALASVGADQDALLQRVVTALSSPEVEMRRAAATQLQQWTINDGPTRRAIDSLVLAMSDADEAVRGRAAQAIGGLKADGRTDATASKLRQLLQDPEAWVRMAAVDALVAIDPGATDLVALLTERVGDSDARVRGSAVQGLEKLGAAARPALPKLVALIADEDSGVRREALDAVSKIAPADVSALAAVSKACNDDDGGVRAQALKMMPAYGAAAVPALANLLRSLQANWRQDAAQRLAEIGSPAVAPLTEALKADDPAVRAVAADAICGLHDAIPAATVGLLTRCADDESPEVRGAALRALECAGEAARVALPTIRSRLTDADPDVRVAAAAAVLEVGGDRAAAVPVLVEGLRTAKDAKYRAMCALESVADSDDRALSALRGLLRDESECFRDYAAAALKSHSDAGTIADLAALASGAVPAATTKCPEGEHDGRRAAVGALEEIGPAAASALPALRKARDATEPPLRDEIDSAIRVISKTTSEGSPPAPDQQRR
jgi:HEAT repeat protein